MSSRKTIGILGGAGVAATAGLVQKIVDIVTDNGARFDQEHPKSVIIQASDAPSRSLWLEGKGPSFIPAYIEAAKSLKLAGADFVVMCCNTAHAAFEEISNGAQIEMINLIELAIEAAIKRTMDKARVGVLCSDGTIKARIFDNALEKVAPNARIIYPEIDFQRLVTEGIIGVKRGLHRNSNSEISPMENFQAAADKLANDGAEVIILGCTEIPLAWNNKWSKCQIIDTIDLLARACVKKSGIEEE